MRMVSSPGKSIRRRREICPGLHALAHRRCCRRPCRRPFQATAGPTTAAPPGVATAPDRRSCTYVRRAAVVASLALFGRRAARSACHCAVLARYSSPPLRGAGPILQPADRTPPPPPPPRPGPPPILQPAAARGGVAAQLARDRGRRTPQPASDLPYALALCATQRDLLAFSEHQIPLRWRLR